MGQFCNSPVDWEVANLLRTCQRHGQQVRNKLVATSCCNVTWLDLGFTCRKRHDTTDFYLPAPTCYGLVTDLSLCCGLVVGNWCNGLP